MNFTDTFHWWSWIDGYVNVQSAWMFIQSWFLDLWRTKLLMQIHVRHIPLCLSCKCLSYLFALLRWCRVLGLLLIVLSVCRDIMSIYKEPPPGMFVVPDPQDMTKVKSRASQWSWRFNSCSLVDFHILKYIKSVCSIVWKYKFFWGWKQNQTNPGSNWGNGCLRGDPVKDGAYWVIFKGGAFHCPSTIVPHKFKNDPSFCLSVVCHHPT